MPKKTKPKVKLTLDISGQIFQAEADTFSEATQTIFKNSLGKVKTWGLFILETEDKKAEIRLTPFQIKKAIMPYGKFARNLLEKKLTLSLK
ncbi:MAG: hypothetical protein U9O94_05225 [Nanoarchaeota archaeon]|nr:hypothetical protein [Nanoarchaeota archaeon]